MRRRRWTRRRDRGRGWCRGGRRSRRRRRNRLRRRWRRNSDVLALRGGSLRRRSNLSAGIPVEKEIAEGAERQDSHEPAAEDHAADSAPIARLRLLHGSLGGVLFRLARTRAVTLMTLIRVATDRQIARCAGRRDRVRSIFRCERHCVVGLHAFLLCAQAERSQFVRRETSGSTARSTAGEHLAQPRAAGPPRHCNCRSWQHRGHPKEKLGCRRIFRLWSRTF